MLEAVQYSENAFVTLTYDDEHMPEGGTLVPRDLQLFLKRLRKKLAPHKIRYFAVGEYGEQTFRPHYHLALFGFGTCVHGVSRYSRSRQNCCVRCDLVRDTWGLGLISLGTLEDASAAYIARYVAKKMTCPHDDRLQGRYPEFARMSLRPGIGGDAMHEVASVLMEFALDDTLVDVPNCLRHGAKLLPLGRYLRTLLRKTIGRDGKVPPAAVKELKDLLRPMLEAAQELPVNYEARKNFFAAKVAEASEGKQIQIEARHRRYNRGSI